MSASSSAPAEPDRQGADGLPSVPLRRSLSAQLARHDDSDPGLAVLIAYNGKVYDVTRSRPWARALTGAITVPAAI
jgi:hypothetical protein